jgi:hypothetical protein
MSDVWRIRWRVILTRQDRHPHEIILTVDSVAELAEIVRRAQRDPEIIRRRHVRLREWCGPVPPHTCTHGITGWHYVSATACTCGTDHRRFHCGNCRINETIPAYGDGCGPVPWAPPTP